MSSALAYRADVDGLRALALIPILFFHVGIDITPGGFIGVDMFFVISGYLIIAIIQRQMTQGVFTLTDFMARRVRRIFPAAFILLVSVLIAGWFLLGPYDYAELGKSARYNALFSANFYFWQQTGYFDTAANLKPLLHTWSLAVEEQFYFLLPLLLLLIQRFQQSTRLLIIAAITLASFMASWWVVRQDIDTAYYLLHTRAWELLLGGLLAFVPTRLNQNRVIAGMIGGAGFLTLIALFITYHHPPAMQFPGPAALPPTLATAAVIWAGPHTWSSRLLALRPVVFVGKISYSWYLWHWPIIVFANYWFPDQLGLTEKLLLLLAGFIMGFISWLLVEEPLRKKKILKTNKPLFATAIACTLLIVISAQQIRVNEGYAQRLPEKAQQYEAARHRNKTEKRCETLTASDLQADKVCRLGSATNGTPPQIVSWGDSHSGALLPLFEDFANEHGISFWHTSQLACPPFISVTWEKKIACNAYNQAMLEFIERHRIPNVILTSRWPAFLDGDDKGNTAFILTPPEGMDRAQFYAENLQKTVTAIRALGSNVWLVKQVPSHPFEPPKHLTVLAMQGKNTEGLGRSYEDHLQHQQAVNRIIDDIARQDGVYVLDATEILCSDHKVCITELGGHSLYRDDNHLSPLGARYIKAMMNPVADFIKTQQSGQP